MTSGDAAALTPETRWRDSLAALLHPRVVAMLFLGFSAGLPLLMIFSSLSLWLREAGVERSAVTLFSWAALGYSFKFVWAPLVDRLPLPWLTRRMGRRRSWLLAAQCAVIAAILLMAGTDPGAGPQALMLMAVAAVLLGFSAATQDIVIDAYRIEAVHRDLQALMAATYIAGYRVGMLASGAGALFIAEALGTSPGQYVYGAWQSTYVLMAATMLVGVVTTLVIAEPARPDGQYAEHPNREYARFLLLFLLAVAALVLVYMATGPAAAAAKSQVGDATGVPWLGGPLIEALRLALGVAAAGGLAMLLVRLRMADRSLVRETYVDPVRDFFSRYGLRIALLLLAVIGLYRISDIVLGVISNVFYQDLGYSKSEIAFAVKTFGLFMTIGGGFLGGILSVRYGVYRILLLGAVLAAVTNLLFMFLAQVGYHLPLLYLVVGADNLCAGLASAAFVAFLSSLTNVSFTAMQYAIFSSLMTLVPKVLGGYSGGMVDTIGYPQFFALTAVMGIPVILLVLLANRWLVVDR
ncbi:MAG: MFS transporter [Gammaproteobacteria bacterium]|nr:MFS transporter [Gammaproteobacteria bacterium]